MAKGIDATSVSAATAKQLVAQGYEFAVRYLTPAAWNSWKGISKREAQYLSDAGLKIGSVYEGTADHAKEGWPAGISDANYALTAAEEIGQPYGSVIYFAVDYDAPESDYQALYAYLVAAGSVLVGKYNVGVYGSYAVVEAMKKMGACKWFWQTYAWSGGRKSSNANLYQYHNGEYINGTEVDLNESFGDEGFWSLAAAQPEPSQPAAPAPTVPYDQADAQKVCDVLSALYNATDAVGVRQAAHEAAEFLRGKVGIQE